MKIKFLTLLASCFLFFSCANDDKSDDEGVLKTHKPFEKGEEITLNSVSKASVTLVRDDNGFKLKNSDKIIMFDIFGTFCIPCQKEAAHLMDYQLKNNENFMLIGLITFEKTSDQEIIDNFIKPFNAYYFISNEAQNSRLIAQILQDISYKQALSLPFKVVLKDGKYQLLSDNLGERGGQKSLFYLGEVSSKIIADDIANLNR